MLFTKISTAVLIAGIAFFVSGWIGAALVHPERLAHPAIKIATPEAAAPSGGRSLRNWFGTVPFRQGSSAHDRVRAKVGQLRSRAATCESFADQLPAVIRRSSGPARCPQ